MNNKNLITLFLLIVSLPIVGIMFLSNLNCEKKIQNNFKPSKSVVVKTEVEIKPKEVNFEWPGCMVDERTNSWATSKVPDLPSERNNWPGTVWSTSPTSLNLSASTTTTLPPRNG